MPLYDIQCGNCSHGEEKLFSSHKDVSEYICPKCGSITWAKIPGRINWVFGKNSITKQATSEMLDIRPPRR